MAAVEALSSVEAVPSSLHMATEVSKEGISLAARRRRMEEQRSKYKVSESTIAEQLSKKLRQSELDTDEADDDSDLSPNPDENQREVEATEAILAGSNCNGLASHGDAVGQSDDMEIHQEVIKEEAGLMVFSGEKTDMETDTTPDLMSMSTESNGSIPRCKALTTHGYYAMCGRRREMEDAVALFPSFVSVPCGSPFGCQLAACDGQTCKFDFFGVYDGHGGYQAAEYCAKNMHSALAAKIQGLLEIPSNPSVQQPAASDSVDQSDPSSSSPPRISWQSAIFHSFLLMDADISGSPALANCNRSDCAECASNKGVERSGSPDDVSKNSAEVSGQPAPLAPETVGSTSVVAIVGRDLIIVANAGDSRAVMGTKMGGAQPLSIDHKPDREDEMRRVESAGGRVIFWNGYRVLGVLAMSRAIGDRYLKPYVIAEPEFTFTKRTDDDEFLILASDGLWDVVSNELACDIARKVITTLKAGKKIDKSEFPFDLEAVEGTPATFAATVLSKVAFAKGSSDNISVVVVDLSSH